MCPRHYSTKAKGIRQRMDWNQTEMKDDKTNGFGEKEDGGIGLGWQKEWPKRRRFGKIRIRTTMKHWQS